ncbi:polymorphic toxin-type HINT domain-containing protein, partial [Streptomyces koyangensis]
ARQRAQRAAAKRAQAARAAARKARANKAPKAKAKPKSQPKPKSKPSQKSKPTQRKTNKVKEEAREQAKDAVGEQAEQAVQEPTSCNSFTPGTKVLMADGSKKAIENIKTGDTVLATDPATGETKAQPVAATIIGTGDKTLVTVTIRTDGDPAPESALSLPTGDKAVALDTSQLHPGDEGASGPETGAIVATDGHPFWVPELDKWLDADQLKPGQRLYTSAGTWIQITDISITSRHATVHNLTVTDTHTYYVLAGETPVLVHNSNCDLPEGYTSSPALKGDPYHPDSVAERSRQNRELYAGTVADRAGALGYRTRIPAQKAPFNSHGQVVFSNGKNYITPDVDGHNVTGGWKMFNRRGQRIGTYDPDLNYLKE